MTEPLVDTTERLHLDIWPAEVYHQGADAPYVARVFITDRRMIIWRAQVDPDTGREHSPYEAMTCRYTTDPPERQRGTFLGQVRLDTPLGTVHVTRATGCGCHSPLKALDPPVGW